MIKKINSLSAKILATFLATFFVSCLIVLTSFYFMFSSHEIEEHELLIADVQELYETETEKHLDSITSILELLADRADVKQAFKTKNRQDILATLSPFYQSLHDSLYITHLYLSDPDFNTIVRLHAPDKYGDKLARHEAAFKSGEKVSSIISQGKLGSISHRVMMPVYEEDIFLGTIELGEEVYETWEVVTVPYHASSYFLLNKSEITEANWIEGKEAFGWTSNWDDLPSYVVVGEVNTEPMRGQNLLKLINDAAHYKTSLHKSSDGHFNYALLPIELNGKQIGDILFAYPSGLVSERIRNALNNALTRSALAMFIGIIVCYLLLRPYAQEMESNRDALEAEVQKHTERLVRLNKDAIAARDQAELANKAKSDFLSNMSHELRTPLNAIIGFSSILKDNEFQAEISEKYQEYATDIHDAGKHLLNIINDILDVSRIEAGKMELNVEPIKVEQLFLDCQLLVNVKATENNIPIVWSIEEEDLTFEGDALRMKQIVLNILTNAIKFTEPPGTISMTAYKTDESHLTIVITDEGAGVPEKEIPVILQRFGKSTSNHTLKNNEEGSGLGLTLVQELVAMHKGTFQFDSVVGAGTTVSLTFPLKFEGEWGTI